MAPCFFFVFGEIVMAPGLPRFLLPSIPLTSQTTHQEPLKEPRSFKEGQEEQGNLKGLGGSPLGFWAPLVLLAFLLALPELCSVCRYHERQGFALWSAASSLLPFPYKQNSFFLWRPGAPREGKGDPGALSKPFLKGSRDPGALSKTC